MNASLRMAVLSLSVLGLAACAGAGAGTKSSYVEPKAPSIMDNDDAYVAYVERTARRRGIEVVWVHVPHKTAEQVAQETGKK
jgi:ABC-type glycerol-3-phosphate transport system substrate-binding protein